MPLPDENTIYVLTGPTAVGKTELSLAWAEAFDAEIISCDSLLFYRGMDIGTAKPTPAELARVRHHMVDICDLTERMDVTRYVAAVRSALSDLRQRGKRPLVTGGSGFYLRSFFHPVADEVEVPADLRLRLEGILQAEGLEPLVNELHALDPAGAATIDLCNPRRVLRALERVHVTGRSLLELAEAFRRQPAPFADWRVSLVRLDREPADLNARIGHRVRAMLDTGLEDEVRRLLCNGLRDNPSAAKAIGYREVIDWVDGKISRTDLGAEIEKNTRALVKKQRTWFRTQLPAHACIPAASADVAGLFSPSR